MKEKRTLFSGQGGVVVLINAYFVMYVSLKTKKTHHNNECVLSSKLSNVLFVQCTQYTGLN